MEKVKFQSSCMISRQSEPLVLKAIIDLARTQVKMVLIQEYRIILIQLFYL